MKRKAASLSWQRKTHLKKFRFAVKNYRTTYVKLAIELEEYIEDGLLNDAIDFSMQNIAPEAELYKHIDDSILNDAIELSIQTLIRENE